MRGEERKGEERRGEEKILYLIRLCAVSGANVLAWLDHLLQQKLFDWSIGPTSWRRRLSDPQSFRLSPLLYMYKVLLLLPVEVIYLGSTALSSITSSLHQGTHALTHLYHIMHNTSYCYYEGFFFSPSFLFFFFSTPTVT